MKTEVFYFNLCMQEPISQSLYMHCTHQSTMSRVLLLLEL